MNDRQQNSTAHPIPFLMILSSDHLSPATGLVAGTSLTVVISKDGGAFATPAGAVTEIGNGWYSLAGNATDRGTLGAFIVHATGTGCDPSDARGTIVGYDPFNGSNLGLTNLDAAVSTRSTYAGGAVASVTAPVTVNLSQLLSAPRALDTVNDNALTINDGLVAAICGAAGQQAVSGTAYTIATPHTATPIRTFTLNSSTAPTTRS